MSDDDRERMLDLIKSRFSPKRTDDKVGAIGSLKKRLQLKREWGDDLEGAVRDDAWHRVAKREDELSPDDPLRCFVAAAKDIQSAEAGAPFKRRWRLLRYAQQHVDAIKIASSKNPYYVHASRWSRAIDGKIKALQQEMARSSELPDVFVVGPPLDPNNPDELELFRMRRDLVSIIDHDLDDDRRGPLLLTGQRRMGKTSLLKMLPFCLGTATTIVTCNFQRLSGSDFPSAPHRLVVHIVALALSKLPDLPALDTSDVNDAWGTALRWLQTLDGILAQADRRVLIAVDEIEALQRGVEEGWTNLTFLDFVRAAGDSLYRIRFLLVSAHPLSSPRLGPKWPDRLISAFPRQLGPLAREDAEQLLRKPVDYFPHEVFDDAAVGMILAQTGTHPFLIQAVGNEIVKRLNADRRLVATTRDVERALDAAVSVAEKQVFTDLWNSFDPEEAALMRRLAQGGNVDPDTPTFRSLRGQFFVELRGGAPEFTFPLFGRWIRDYRS